METTEVLIKELKQLATAVSWRSKQIQVANPNGKGMVEEIEIYGQEDGVAVGPFVVRAEIFMLVGVNAVARFVHQEYQTSREAAKKKALESGRNLLFKETPKAKQKPEQRSGE